jgi:putative oxidoreductase
MWNDAAAKNTLVPLILRLALAVIFIYHGWHKVADPGNDWGAVWASNLNQKSLAAPPEVLRRLEQWEQMDREQRKEGPTKDQDPLLPQHASERVKAAFDRLAVADPRYYSDPGNLQLQFFIQLLVAWGELVGGIAMLLGCLTRLAALGLIVIQVGAIATVTWAQGFSAAGGAGYEYNLALIAMCLAVMALGGGSWSLDGMLRRRPAVAAKEPGTTAAPVAV